MESTETRTYRVVANGTDMGTYVGVDSAEAFHAYLNDAGYCSVVHAASACNQKIMQFLDSVEMTRIA